jgi:hypothetical protein
MPLEAVSRDAWTEVATTTADTVFQNRNGAAAMYITTEDTTELPFDEGFYLPPNTAVVISEGLTVSAVSFSDTGIIFYMEV